MTYTCFAWDLVPVSDPINGVPLGTSETRNGGLSNQDETSTSYVVERES